MYAAKFPARKKAEKSSCPGTLRGFRAQATRLLQKKFRAAAVQMGKLACTDAQTLPGLTRMSKKAIAELRMRGEIAGVR